MTCGALSSATCSTPAQTSPQRNTLRDIPIWMKVRRMSCAEEAAVARFSPHDMRRTFISDLLDAGVDIATAQHLSGHSDLDESAPHVMCRGGRRRPILAT